MAGRLRVTPARELQGWFQAAHPFPIAMVLCLTALVGVVSAGGEPRLGRLALVLCAMLLSQLAIGWTNDYLDRARDAAFQPAKPVPSGLVEAGRLPVASLLALLGSFGAGAGLGWAPFGFLLIGTLAGLVYDGGVKDTRLSWLPYVIAFAVLPPFVWSALDVYRDDFLSLYLVASPLAVAAHVANVLPDIDSDAAAGRRGIAVRLGRQAALGLLAVCLAAPAGFALLTLLWLDYEVAVLAVTLIAYALLLLAAACAYRLPSFAGGASLAFKLIVVAAVLFATGWLTAI